jgi:hypothetical protein
MLNDTTQTNWRTTCKQVAVRLCCALALYQTPEAWAESLDLTSSTPASVATSTGTIRVGGNIRNVQQGELVTPAQLTAINQIATTGRQTIILDNSGTAIGGTVQVPTNQSLSSLVIPNNVTALVDFSHQDSLSVIGTLINHGNLYAFSTANNLSTIFADNLINNRGATVSTILPPGLVTHSLPSFDLNISVIDAVRNAGTISSSGNLSIYAGSGNIANEGLIIASRDVNFSAASANSLNINNAGGTIAAYNGTINVRELSYAGSANITLNGGDFISKTLNLYGGTSVVSAAVNAVSGVVNIHAKETHFQAATDTLSFGTLNLCGDPTFYNTTGSIIMNNLPATFGASLAIIAAKDVIITGGTLSTESVTGGVGGDITIVAGAGFVGAPGLGETNPAPSTGPITIGLTGPYASGSLTGGLVRLDVDGINSGGGDVRIVAFPTPDVVGKTSSDTSGDMFIPPITTKGGNIIVIAGATWNAGHARMSISDLDASGQGGAPDGSVFFATGVPQIQGGGGQITINADGSIAAGSGEFTAKRYYAMQGPIGDVIKGGDITLLSLSGYWTETVNGRSDFKLQSSGNVQMAGSLGATTIDIEAAGSFKHVESRAALNAGKIKIVAQEIYIESARATQDTLDGSLNRIDLQSDGTIKIERSLYAYSRNGPNAPGGLIHLTTRVPGSGDVHVINNGVIFASDQNDRTGVVAFNAGPNGKVLITYERIERVPQGIFAGHYVGIGDIDPVTLRVRHPVSTDYSNFNFPLYSIRQDDVPGEIRYSDPSYVPPALPPQANQFALDSFVPGSTDWLRAQIPPHLLEGDHIKLPIDPTIAPTDSTMVGDVGLPPLEDSAAFSRFHHLHPSHTNENTHLLLGSAIGNALPPGWYLIAPDHKTVISTALCQISVDKHAVVLVHVQEHRVSVYDMSDTHLGDVTAIVGKQSIELHPGQQLTVANVQGLGSEQQLPIAVRHSHTMTLQNGLSALFSDFSIPCALSNANLYKTLSNSGNAHERSVLNRILKAAAAVQTITSEYGPYEGAL